MTYTLWVTFLGINLITSLLHVMKTSNYTFQLVER